MPRILNSSIYTTPLLVLSLLLILMSLPGGQNSPWNSLRPTAGATTFYVVNSTGDGPDSNLADGVCNDGTGACTFRAAMQEANTVAGDDTITFDISLNFHIITLNTALPDISGNLNFSGNGSSLLTVQRSTAAGTPDFRIFTINSGTTVTITGLTISNGHVAGNVSPANLGAAILNSGNLTLNFCAVSGNSGGNGVIQNLDTITINNSVVSGNTGGGLSNSLFGANTTATINQSTISGNTLGSGIFNNGANGIANLTINNSTISGNTTENVAGGGGIFNGAGSFTSRANLTINNSTISGNSATAGAGGGIYSAAVFGNALTTLTLVNSTVTGNSCSGDGGGILHFSNGSGSTALATITNSTITGNSAGSTSGKGGGISTSLTPNSITTFSLRNTIIANNTASGAANAPDLSGDFASQDYNLIKNTSGATFTGPTTHNITGLDSNLGPLGDYGGTTRTMLPFPNSPAIDYGDVSNLPVDTTDTDGDGNTSELLPIDQRGFPRVVNTRFDIGAVEANYSITATEGSGQSTAINTAFATQLKATVTESGNPRSGIQVEFTKPASGPSGTFSASPFVTTDINGVAAIGFSADGTPGGPYNVLAALNSFDSGPFPNPAMFSLTNLKGTTATAVTSSVNPSAFGQNVTFAASVTSASGTPVGTIQFRDGPDALGSAVNCDPVVGGCSGQVSTSALGVGTHTISAEFSGNVNFLGSVGMLPSGQVVNLELAINDVTITEGDNGTHTADFTVTLTAGSLVQVNVDFATANGTALAGSDYQSTSGTLTFSPGQTTKPISVNINGDISFESNEDFMVILSNPVNAVIKDGQGLGTISNDDAQGGFISFSQSGYVVGESGGAITITVNRTNDISRAATVDYATSDPGVLPGTPCSAVNGNASSRCDFTTAAGTLRFAAGESSKAFTVLISQDNYVEGPESLTLTLSNLTGGALFEAPSMASLTITDDATEPAANPVDDADVFVRQHYHDFLNREPDAAGLAFWTNQITECQQPGATCSAEVRRINVSAAFFLSIEFQETGDFVYRTYKASYGNIVGTPVPVTLAEFLPDTQQIGKDVIIGQPGAEQLLEANKVAYALDFVTRSRFTTAYSTTLTPAQFVDMLFTNAGVIPSTADRDAAINEFGGAGNTADTAARARSLRRVADNSTLRQQESNKAFVLMQSVGYLRRNPYDPPEVGLDFAGYNFWLGKLNEFNGNFVNAEMVKAFIVSGEYRHRFGP